MCASLNATYIRLNFRSEKIAYLFGKLFFLFHDESESENNHQFVSFYTHTHTHKLNIDDDNNSTTCPELSIYTNTNNFYHHWNVRSHLPFVCTCVCIYAYG